ncbi:hypothetical protein AB4865_00410 [Capnocytophaga sp. ARDL2]|uniref:hypothetical protein n=1 Tax=Capnocytophaga sp. ARDL2 TaxID=3238809 RepID=UPI00355669A2
MKNLLFLSLIISMISCKEQEKVDLFQLELNEKVENIISKDENIKKFIGTESIEHPLVVLVEDTDANCYSISDISVDKVFLLLKSSSVKHQFAQKLLLG